MPGANWMPLPYALVDTQWQSVLTVADRPPVFGRLPGTWVVAVDPGRLAGPAPSDNTEETRGGSRRRLHNLGGFARAPTQRSLRRTLSTISASCRASCARAKCWLVDRGSRCLRCRARLRGPDTRHELRPSCRYLFHSSKALARFARWAMLPGRRRRASPQ